VSELQQQRNFTPTSEQRQVRVQVHRRLQLPTRSTETHRAQVKPQLKVQPLVEPLGSVLQVGQALALATESVLLSQSVEAQVQDSELK
jgi:hypothetical protein